MTFVLPPLADLADLKTIRADFEKATLKGKADLEPQVAVETARSTLAGCIHRAVYPPLHKALVDLFEEAHDRHDLIEGERPRDRGDAAEWDERLATAIENALGNDTARVLGNGWLGEALIGPRLYEAAVREKTAASAAYILATNVYAILPAVAVGLTDDDIMAAARRRTLGNVNTHAILAPKQEPAGGDPAVAVRDLADHLRDLADLGRTPDLKVLAQELELIGDYDEVLTPGALQRSGLDEGIQIHVAAFREANGSEWASKLVLRALDAPKTIEAPEGASEAKASVEPPEPAAEASPPAVGRKRIRKPSGEGAAAAGGPIPRKHVKSVAGALVLIATHAGKSGRDLAEALGVTQTNWSKMVTGKMPPMLSRDQVGILAEAIKADYVGLGEAVDRLEKAMLA